jgi:hypothetical protein
LYGHECGTKSKVRYVGARLAGRGAPPRPPASRLAASQSPTLIGDGRRSALLLHCGPQQLRGESRCLAPCYALRRRLGARKQPPQTVAVVAAGGATQPAAGEKPFPKAFSNARV